MRLLTVLLFCLSITAQAQNLFVTSDGDTIPGTIIINELPDQITADLSYAGERLQGAATTGIIGGTFIFLGATTTAISALINKPGVKGDLPRTLAMAGGGAMAVGGIITITAFIPIDVAGRTLKNLFRKKPTPTP